MSDTARCALADLCRSSRGAPRRGPGEHTPDLGFRPPHGTRTSCTCVLNSHSGCCRTFCANYSRNQP
eukprot:4138870-Prymnesium_polylepis.3